jgi:putative hemolysin
MESWKIYFFLTLFALFIQGFFAMLEMACISFNKVRLQYYVSQGRRRALWLKDLLDHPALLFGTTLIMITAALQVGSEAARRFYLSLGLSPDWALLSQSIAVVIMAEIAPMVSGRLFSERAAMFGLPILYATSIFLRPIIWILDQVCHLTNQILGISSRIEHYLSREELQKIIEETEEGPQNLNQVAARIFSLKNKIAKELMQSVDKILAIPISCTVERLHELLSKEYFSFIPVYQRNRFHIVAIAYPRDLLRLDGQQRVRDFARPPWFIDQNTSILEILKQFRRNNQSVAVVLNEMGVTTGILTLDEITDEIFGQDDRWMSFSNILPRTHRIIVDRTFSGDFRIADFNHQFHIHLPFKGAETLEGLMESILEHPPVKGDSIRLEQFELTVEEVGLFGSRTISVRTIY